MTHRIGDFLTRVRIPVTIDDEQSYRLVTIRMRHQGVCLRTTKSGIDIGTKTMYRVKAGQFILSGIDARNGAFGIIPDELDGAVVTNDFWYFDIDETVIDKSYFLYLTSTPFFDNLCRLASDGTTNRVRLQANKFFNYEVTLPPIEEQRSVLKELLTLNSKLTELQTELAKQDDLLKKLQQSILQDAVQGKLTKGFREQEAGGKQNGADLLAQIRAEKAELINAKKLKKEKPLPPITDAEMPFDLPKGWVWCRLGECILSAKDGPHFSPSYAEDGILFISTRNIRPDGIDFSTAKFISKEYHAEISKKCKPEKGDILYTKGGTTGIACVNESELEFNVWVHVAVLKKSSFINSYYLKHCLNSHLCYEQSQKLTRGIGNQDLGLIRMVKIYLPLPPLAEQGAIVEEIERVINKVLQLQLAIADQREIAEALLKALLHQAFSGGDLVEEESV